MVSKNYLPFSGSAARDERPDILLWHNCPEPEESGANSANITVLYLKSLQILSTTKKLSHNLKYSPSWWKQLENIQFQGGPRIVSAQQICGTIELRPAEPATIMAPILCPGHGARTVHHSIMTRQYLSSLERDTGNKTRPPPGLSPGLGCPGPRQTLGRSEKPKQ